MAYLRRYDEEDLYLGTQSASEIYWKYMMVSEVLSHHVYVPLGLALTKRTDGAIRAATSKALRECMVKRTESKMAMAPAEEKKKQQMNGNGFFLQSRSRIGNLHGVTINGKWDERLKAEAERYERKTEDEVEDEDDVVRIFYHS